MADSLEQSAAAELLHEVLIETATAHGRYEKEHLGGVYDENWPAWYAAFMSQVLADRGYALVGIHQ
jgi:hypothetical protein